MNQIKNIQFNYSVKILGASGVFLPLLLVVIVMLLGSKNYFPTRTASWIIFGLINFMTASIQFYGKCRRNHK